ncbi:MAG: RdgB/HAM1 family non-canonical purine NTP pyrophosphatase [Methanomicrobiales archaeon]|nr:RdgB/HAM1 family non-canonical purine NTP pyrophosphatase [Methanomicrobiales archaeon]
MNITVVTSNRNKAREVAAFFQGVATVDHVPLECPEYRDDDVGAIAREKARFAYEHLKKPLIVDDTGFFIPALGGFPGPYAAYVLGTIGLEGVLRLMEGKEDTRAWFETAIAYADEGGIRIFRGRIEGVIVAPRGSGGFGYDPIVAVDGRTLAEMPLAEKAGISHRGRALAALKEWLAAGGPDSGPHTNC